MEQRNDFSKNKMRANILQVALPLTVAELVNVLYNIVDRLYLSHMPGIGLMALTGVGVSAPLLRLIAACANLGGRGGAPLCSIARGRGDLEAANRYMGNALTILLVLSVVTTAAGYLFMEPILYWAGASSATYPYASQYFSIYLIGTGFVLLNMGMNNFINAQGFGKVGMLSIVIGAVINIVLDPLFIYVLDLGVRGAAIATVIAQFCSAAWVMLFLCGKRTILRLRLSYLKPQWRYIKDILALGASGFIMAATTSAVGMACNGTLQRLGGDGYVAVMTVINSISGLFQTPARGLGHGAQPAIGFNYGAGLYHRMQEGIRFVSRLVFAVCAALWLFMLIAPGVMIRLFNSDPAFVATAIPCVRIYYCAFVCMAMQSIGQSVHVALGRPKEAIVFSLLRKVGLVLPLIFLLTSVPSIGVYGVFLAEPISEVIGGAACYWSMRRNVRRVLASAPEAGA